MIRELGPDELLYVLFALSCAGTAYVSLSKAEGTEPAAEPEPPV